VGLGIDTPAGLIVHTGDYKFDHTPVDNWPTDYAKLAELQSRGVLALLADSTNSERQGWTPSERVIDDAFDRVFREAPGRIIIASFASLVSRMQQVANTALRYNRKMAFAGTSMVDNAKIARKLGYLEIPDALLVSLEEALNMDEEKVTIMCTGSQGEPTSILGRLSTGTHRQIEVKPGDTVVLSSHPIPGNEENVFRTINQLFARGANVIYENLAPVHVSGHASQEEMKLMMHLTQPKYFIPIHGELRQLRQHARLAEQVGIPAQNISVITNGQTVEFYLGEMRLGERIPASYDFVDGSGVGMVDNDVMREREMLSQDGMVIINLSIDKLTGRVSGAPEILSKGFIVMSEADTMMRDLREKIAATAAHANGNLKTDIEKMVGNTIYGEIRRRPMVLVNVVKS
jgi:ribonuclease J